MGKNINFANIDRLALEAINTGLSCVKSLADAEKVLAAAKKARFTDGMTKAEKMDAVQVESAAVKAAKDATANIYETILRLYQPQESVIKSANMDDLRRGFDVTAFLDMIGVTSGDGDLTNKAADKIDGFVGAVTSRGYLYRKSGETMLSTKKVKDKPDEFILAVALGIFESGAFKADVFTKAGRLEVRDF